MGLKQERKAKKKGENFAQIGRNQKPNQQHENENENTNNSTEPQSEIEHA
jgi:hypothetical protein